MPKAVEKLSDHVAVAAPAAHRAFKRKTIDLVGGSPIVQIAQHEAFKTLKSKVRGKAVLSLIKLCSGIDVLEFGCDRGLLGGTPSRKRFQEMLGRPGPTMESLLSAIYGLGCTICAVLTFILGDRMGRVGTIYHDLGERSWCVRKWPRGMREIIQHTDRGAILNVGVIQTAYFDYWQVFAGRIIVDAVPPRDSYVGGSAQSHRSVSSSKNLVSAWA